MYKLILFFGIYSAFASGSKPPEKLSAKDPAKMPVPDNKCNKIVGCYYTNNQDEMPVETLNIEMIDVSLCTHLFYSNAYIDKNASIQVLDEFEEMGEYGAFQRINNLRKKSRSLKILIAMEETFEEADKNKKILFEPSLRENIVNNIIKFLQKYNFNGIELHSLYLFEENADASDKQNFVLLLKALKEKFDKKDLILSLAVDARESTAKKYDIKKISKYASFINLRTYHFHGDFYKDEKILKAGNNAPLYHSSKENTEERKLNVDYIVKYWLSEGAPPSKLILGTTVNGIYYTLADPKKVGRDAPVVDSVKCAISPIQYYIICQKEKDSEWSKIYDKEQQVPYIHSGKDMIAYDDVESIKRKAEYAKKMKLGGVFLDSIDMDDFSGHCGGEKSPLLRTLNRVLRDKC